MPYMALKLGYPDWVEAETTLLKPESPPAASTIRFQFSSRSKMPPVQLIWYDGGRMPKRPEELEPGRRMGHEYGGALFHGSRGILMVGCYGDSPRLIPERKMREYQRPPRSLPRSVGHYLEFIEACKGKGTTGASFDYAGPFTEMFLLGILAIRTGWRIEFDPKEMRVTNCPEANRSLRREYRKGWAQ
jgi:hypothetical protein